MVKEEFSGSDRSTNSTCEASFATLHAELNAKRTAQDKFKEHVMAGKRHDGVPRVDNSGDQLLWRDECCPSMPRQKLSSEKFFQVWMV